MFYFYCFTKLLYGSLNFSFSLLFFLFFIYYTIFFTYIRAVLVYPPSLDFIIAFIACLRAGIVAVPVFPPQPARKDTLVMFSTIVASCNAKYALTNTSYSHLKKLSSKLKYRLVLYIFYFQKRYHQF